MHRGYLKLYRKIEDWGWYNDLQTLGFFVHLLTQANHKPSTYMGHQIPRGSLVFGRKRAAKDFKVGEQVIRTMVTRLKSTNEITVKTTNKFSIVSIVNFNFYQPKPTSKTTNKQTNGQPTTNQQLTTSKEVKNVRTQEEDKYPAQSAADFEQLVDNSKQVDLQDVEIAGQTESVKHKIYNQVLALFQERGWKTDPEYLKTVFQNIVAEMDGYNPKEFFPYFKKVAFNHINRNAEAYAADARIKRGQEKKIGLTVAGVSI